MGLPIDYAPSPEDQERSSLVKINALLFALAGYPQPGNAGQSFNPASYISSAQLVTNNGNIPAGALSWSFQAVSGTVTINGAALANGTAVSGGGYGSAKLATAIPYTITGGSALLVIDTEAS